MQGEGKPFICHRLESTGLFLFCTNMLLLRDHPLSQPPVFSGQPSGRMSLALVTAKIKPMLLQDKILSE